MQKPKLDQFMVFRLRRMYPLILLLLAAMCMFAMQGCKQEQQSNSHSLVFGCFLNSPAHQKELESLLSEFEKKEGIKVEMIGLNWSDGKTKLISAFNAGTEPDIVELGSDWVAQFSGGGVLSPLTKQEVQTERFPRVAMLPAQWGEHLYAVPWVLSTRIMFVNKDLCKKAGIPDGIYPRTIEELRKQAAMIHQIDTNQFFGVGIVSQDLHQVYKRVLPIFWSNGGDILDQKGNPTFTLQQNRESLKHYVSLVPYGIIESAKQLDKMFIQGKIGFWVSGPWLLEKIPKENPGLHIGLALVPGVKPNTGLSFTGGDYLAISARSNKREKALRLIQFLTSGPATLRLCKLSITAGIPADKSAQQDPFFSSIEGFPVFIEQLEKSRLSAVHPKWLDIEAAYELAISQAVYGALSVEEALEEAQASVNALLNH